MKRCLAIFADISDRKNNYMMFYERIREHLHFGLHADSFSRSMIGELLLFRTSKSCKE